MQTANIANMANVLTQAQRHFSDNLRRSRAAIEYLIERGVSARIAKQFELGYARDTFHALAGALPLDDRGVAFDLGLLSDKGVGVYDRFVHRLMFPIRDALGQLCGFAGRALDEERSHAKYLNSPDSFAFHKGQILYGLHLALPAIREAGRVYVVEGFFDLLQAHQAGLTNTVSTMGTAMTPEHAQILSALNAEIVLCFDGDAAGQQAALSACELLAGAVNDDTPVTVVSFPDDTDPDDVLREGGQEALEGYRDEHGTSFLVYLISDRAARIGPMDSAENRARLLVELRPVRARMKPGQHRAKLDDYVAAATGLPDVAEYWQ